MAIFEIRQGALVPAQLGGVADESAHRQALDLVREQVAQVLRRPLFPVAWKQLDAGHSLVAIDGSGQVVAVELLPKLDSTTVVAAMGRLNATSHLGWAEIASLYPAGPTAFQKDWTAFRETMPARINPGPRLSIVSPSVSPDVLSSLSVLSDSGLEVFSLSVRSLSSGRNFVEIDRIDSHHLPVSAKLLPAGDPMDEGIEVGKSEATAAASAPSAATSTSAAASAPSVATPAAPVPPAAPSAPTPVASHSQPSAAPASPGAAASRGATSQGSAASQGAGSAAGSTTSPSPVSRRSRRAQRAANQYSPHAPTAVSPAAVSPTVVSAPTPAPSPAVTPGYRQSAPSRNGQPVRATRVRARVTGQGRLSRRDSGQSTVSRSHPSGEDSRLALNALASILSEPVQITWQSVTEGIFHTAQLRPDGMIRVSDGTSFDEPGQAAHHCEPAKSVDGWDVWRFGADGPSLYESLEELIAAAERSPRRPGRPVRSRRQGR
ncbi:MAG: hypothetical protein KH147_05050 [Actinomyces graevenitzii]|uniref:RAMA domain-containing protein n=1 Tax=Actinomyces graevenitzii C83 TaxID=435830 RepID=G9PGX7_9ACTO|nr:hypothetical protein [Actinomyces graevenitzii]EHM87442.1 hypothetical protein HMPREF0045_01501 [Actinomyces graevenitzii C83]MBS6934568.1 hypothetical protein [Actinomyces graevenitzii]